MKKDKKGGRKKIKRCEGKQDGKESLSKEMEDKERRM